MSRTNTYKRTRNQVNEDNKLAAYDEPKSYIYTTQNIDPDQDIEIYSEYNDGNGATGAGQYVPAAAILMQDSTHCRS